jgi:hypothetical protein
MNNSHIAIHRSPVFGSTRIRRSTQIRYGLLDAEPSDDPELFDVLLTDVDHRILHRGVSEELGCTYLSPATKVLKPIPEINGVLFGLHQPALCRYCDLSAEFLQCALFSSTLARRLHTYPTL